MEKDNIIEIKDLHVDIKMMEGTLTPVRGVNFEIKKGETLGLVGESGCGKSITCKAILGINDKKCMLTLTRPQLENILLEAMTRTAL